MNTKHKYYDVIVAWANGEKIQFNNRNEWKDYKYNAETAHAIPAFNNTSLKWRVKPETITKRYRMALLTHGEVLAYDVTKASIDDPIEYYINGFIRWVGEAVEVEIEQ